MHTNNYDELGLYFIQTIQKEARKEIDALKSEIIKLKAEAKTSILEELEIEKDHILETKNKDITKKYQELLAEKKRALDLLVMEKRTKLAEALFQELFERIKDFRTTKEYPNWFKKKLKQYDLHLFHEIEVNEKDVKLVPTGLKAIVSETIIAGFILHKKDKSAFVLETLLSNVERAKQHFYHHAKWFTE